MFCPPHLSKLEWQPDHTIGYKFSASNSPLDPASVSLLPPLSVGCFLRAMASRHCQKKDRDRHKLICGKTRSEIDAAYEAFRNSGGF